MRSFLVLGDGSRLSLAVGVPDKSTALLMRQLYGHLAKFGVDRARALQQSQLELLALNFGGRRPYEHPFY